MKPPSGFWLCAGLAFLLFVAGARGPRETMRTVRSSPAASEKPRDETHRVESGSVPGKPERDAASGGSSIEARRFEMLEDILGAHRRACVEDRDPGLCRSGGSSPAMVAYKFSWDRAFAWARCFPDDAERLMGVMAADPGANADDRDLACRMLGVLAEHGRATAEGLLVAVALSSADLTSRIATYALSRADQDGRHIALYMKSARQGDLSAIETLSWWPHLPGRRVLEEIVAAAEGRQENWWMDHARRALNRLNELSSPGGEAYLRACLEAGSAGGYEDFGWALRVARIRQLPGLERVLQGHVDRAEEAARTLHSYDVYLADPSFYAMLEALDQLGQPLTPQRVLWLEEVGRRGNPRETLERGRHDPWRRAVPPTPSEIREWAARRVTPARSPPPR